MRKIIGVSVGLIILTFAFAFSVLAWGSFKRVEYGSPAWLDNATILAVKYTSVYKRGSGILADISNGRTVPFKDEIQIISINIDGTQETVIKNIIIDWPNLSPKWREEEFKDVKNTIGLICYNPQRRLLAFGSNKIFIIGLDGKLVKAIKGVDFRWSPDGSRLLYQVKGRSLRIYEMDSGKDYKLLDNAASGVWHPGGEKVYYIFDKNPGTPKGDKKTYLFDIKSGTKEIFRSGFEWPIDVSENGKVLLFYPWNIFNENGKSFAKGYALNNPRLSPDGKRLVGDPIKDEDKGFMICVVNIDGSGKQLLK